MYWSVYQYEQHKYISTKEQHGFRRNLSKYKTTYKLTDDTFNAINNKLLIVDIIGDLEKAIDCVNHEKLLLKLKFHRFANKSNASKNRI